MKDAMQKELAREIAAYERSVNPNYIAKKMVREYLRIIDRNWRKGGDPKVLKKAKSCAQKTVDEMLKAIQSTMDVKMTARSAQDRENIRKYREVKSRIENL